MKIVLKFDDVMKAFGGVVTSNHVTFEVQEREIMGLIGPNGAGKTTTLNLISGLYSCDSGKIYFYGRDITKMPADKRARLGISRTFQQPRFMRGTTIYENLLIGADLAEKQNYLVSFFGAKKTKLPNELDNLFDIAGLNLNLQSDVSSLPYGQRKLLEIVRALLAKPKLMLVDEPAAGLNHVEQERVSSLLHYSKERGIAIILIEHKMDMIMSICDKISVLNFGKLIAYGTPEEILRNKSVQEAYLGREDDDAEDT